MLLLLDGKIVECDEFIAGFICEVVVVAVVISWRKVRREDEVYGKEEEGENDE